MPIIENRGPQMVGDGAAGHSSPKVLAQRKLTSSWLVGRPHFIAWFRVGRLDWFPPWW